MGDDLAKLTELEDIPTQWRSREYAPGASELDIACRLLVRWASHVPAGEGSIKGPKCRGRGESAHLNV